MKIGKPITETPKEGVNFKGRFLSSFQKEVDKLHCMFWNFTMQVSACKQPLIVTVVSKNAMRCSNITGPCTLSLGLHLTAHGQEKDVHW